MITEVTVAAEFLFGINVETLALKRSYSYLQSTGSNFPLLAFSSSDVGVQKKLNTRPFKYHR